MNVWAFRRLVRENRALMLEHSRCPLGAAVGIGHFEEKPACVWAADFLGVDEDYCFGVAMGFDGDSTKWLDGSESKLGHRFGKRMRIVAGITEDGGES